MGECERRKVDLGTKRKAKGGYKHNRLEQTIILAVNILAVNILAVADPASLSNKEMHLLWAQLCVGYSLGFSTSIKNLTQRRPELGSMKAFRFHTVSDKSIYFNLYHIFTKCENSSTMPIAEGNKKRVLEELPKAIVKSPIKIVRFPSQSLPRISDLNPNRWIMRSGIAYSKKKKRNGPK